MTAAKGILQYLKSTANFQLHINSNSINISIRNSLIVYSDSDWANGSADRELPGGHVFLTTNRAVTSQS
jgi:hypothetical protein